MPISVASPVASPIASSAESPVGRARESPAPPDESSILAGHSGLEGRGSPAQASGDPSVAFWVAVAAALPVLTSAMAAISWFGLRQQHGWMVGAAVAGFLAAYLVFAAVLMGLRRARS